MDAASEGQAFGGCGFLVGIESRHRGQLYVYVVTNRHVVDGGNHTVRLNTQHGGSSSVTVDPGSWCVAVDDDLAVTAIKLPVDAKYQALSTELFIEGDCTIEGWPIFPGDESFFYGRFVAHDGRQTNKPIMRFGNVAMLPDEHALVSVGNDHHQLAFLVECRSTSGFSGAPAFVRLAQPRLMDDTAHIKGWIPNVSRLLV